MKQETGVWMLSRLLLTALILLGQFPMRVCTCGAHAQHPPDTLLTNIWESGVELVNAIAPETLPEPVPHDEPQSPHDPDCPAANPRPALESAPIPPVQTAPADAVDFERVTLPLCPTAPVVFDEPPPIRPPVPLFISLLNLRV